ncbi:hypothetical protein CEXT_734112, partial [Caerostris extrusa]
SIMSHSKEELRPQVDKLVQRFMGFSEPSQSLISTAVRCLVKGYDQKEAVGLVCSHILTGLKKMSSYLDSSKSEKLTEQLFRNFGNDSDSKRKSKKRHREDEIRENKKYRVEDHPNLPLAGLPSPSQLTTIQAGGKYITTMRFDSQHQVVNYLPLPLSRNRPSESELHVSAGRSQLGAS